MPLDAFGNEFALTLGAALLHAGWEPVPLESWRWKCPGAGLVVCVLTGHVVSLLRDDEPGTSLQSSREEDPARAAVDVAMQVQKVRKQREQMRRERPLTRRVNTDA